MAAAVNYYQVLGLPHDATERQLTDRFHKLSLIYHPDKGGTDEGFRGIHEAYKELLDPTKREQHDKLLAETGRRFNPEGADDSAGPEVASGDKVLSPWTKEKCMSHWATSAKQSHGEEFNASLEMLKGEMPVDQLVYLAISEKVNAAWKEKLLDNAETDPKPTALPPGTPAAERMNHCSFTEGGIRFEWDPKHVSGLQCVWLQTLRNVVQRELRESEEISAIKNAIREGEGLFAGWPLPISYKPVVPTGKGTHLKHTCAWQNLAQALKDKLAVARMQPDQRRKRNSTDQVDKVKAYNEKRKEDQRELVRNRKADFHRAVKEALEARGVRLVQRRVDKREVWVPEESRAAGAGQGAAQDQGQELRCLVRVHTEAPVSLSPASMTRGCVFTGPPGSGKTVAMKTVMIELAKFPSMKATFAIDPKGDLAQNIKASPETRLNPELRRQSEEFEQLVDLRVLTTATEAGMKATWSPFPLPMQLIEQLDKAMEDRDIKRQLDQACKRACEDVLMFAGCIELDVAPKEKMDKVDFVMLPGIVRAVPADKTTSWETRRTVANHVVDACKKVLLASVKRHRLPGSVSDFVAMFKARDRIEMYPQLTEDDLVSLAGQITAATSEMGGVAEPLLCAPCVTEPDRPNFQDVFQVSDIVLKQSPWHAGRKHLMNIFYTQNLTEEQQKLVLQGMLLLVKDFVHRNQDGTMGRDKPGLAIFIGEYGYSRSPAVNQFLVALLRIGQAKGLVVLFDTQCPSDIDKNLVQFMNGPRFIAGKWSETEVAEIRKKFMRAGKQVWAKAKQELEKVNQDNFEFLYIKGGETAESPPIIVKFNSPCRMHLDTGKWDSHRDLTEYFKEVCDNKRVRPERMSNADGLPAESSGTGSSRQDTESFGGRSSTSSSASRPPQEEETPPPKSKRPAGSQSPEENQRKKMKG